MAFGNFGVNGEDPVSKRKAAQRKSAIATVLGKSDTSTPAPDAPPATADATDAPLPASDATVEYSNDPSHFSCANCNYFVADNQPCQKVSDPVTSDGRCKQFDPASGGSNDQQNQPNPAETNPYGGGNGQSMPTGSAGGPQ